MKCLRHWQTTWAWLGMVLALPFAVSCVSVSVRTDAPKKAQGLNYTPPGGPFESFQGGSADASWRNTKTGSVISFLSECEENASMTLSALRNDVLRVLQDLKVESEVSSTYLGREALRTQASGRLEGVLTTVDLLVVRRNDCNFTLSLVSLPKFYGQDRFHFDRFLEGFRAP